MTDSRKPNPKKKKKPKDAAKAPDRGTEPLSRGVRAREEDYIESRFPGRQATLVMLIALAVLCVAGGVHMGRISIAVPGVIVFIELLMGFFLGNAPAFITIMLTALMMAAGMFTKTLEAVAPGCIVFIATVLVVKDR